MTKKEKGNKYCWHYTTGEKFIAIVESNAIYTEAKTTPISIFGMVDAAWFSKNQKWEPTATKGIIDKNTGCLRDATRKEMIHLAGGLVRFGVSTDSSFLLTWEEWKQKCTCGEQAIRKMELIAQRKGSNIKDYRACITDVPRELWEVIDVWENGKWERVPTQNPEVEKVAA